MAYSQASMSVESDIRRESDLGDNLSGLSVPGNTEGQTTKRRRRWTFETFQFRRVQNAIDDNNAPVVDPTAANPSQSPAPTTKFRAFTVSCRCKGAVKGSFLIMLASFAELILNVLALVYGISYILNAIDFYEMDITDPSIRASEYEADLERLLFLNQNRVAFVGLLAVSFIGVFVAFLMPVGTIYKSWKCLRAAMSLLLAMCIFHMLLVANYVQEYMLLASLFIVPFRAYEIVLIAGFIQFYKKKKCAALKQMDGGATGTIEETSQELIGEEGIRIRRVGSRNDPPMQMQLMQAGDQPPQGAMQVKFDMVDNQAIVPTREIDLKEQDITVEDYGRKELEGVDQRQTPKRLRRSEKPASPTWQQSDRPASPPWQSERKPYIATQQRQASDRYRQDYDFK